MDALATTQSVSNHSDCRRLVYSRYLFQQQIVNPFKNIVSYQCADQVRFATGVDDVTCNWAKPTDVTKTDVRVYDPATPVGGVLKFILGSKPDQLRAAGSLRLPVEKYYDCHVTSRFDELGNLPRVGGGMTASLCSQYCSTDADVFARAHAMPDTVLHVDYTKSTFRSTCSGLEARSGDQLSAITDYILHHSPVSDVLLSFDVVLHGGFVDKGGLVLTLNDQVIHAHQCNKPNSELILGHRTMFFASCVPEVFVLTQHPLAFNFYHSLIEQITRAVAYRAFLQAHPHVAVHVGQEKPEFASVVLNMFGIHNPVVSGDIRAKRIYIPQGGGCHNPHTASVQLAAQYFHQFTEKHLLQRSTMTSQPHRRFIVLIKRTTRALVNHEAVLGLVHDLAARTQRDVYVYDDRNLPSFNDSVALFYRSDVIIGPHGAGLTNMIFSRPATFVVEIHCVADPDSLRVSIQLLALKLGLRYHGGLTVRTQAYSSRCNREGIIADIDELRALFDTISQHLL